MIVIYAYVGMYAVACSLVYVGCLLEENWDTIIKWIKGK